MPGGWVRVERLSGTAPFFGSGLWRGRVLVLPEGDEPVRFLAYGITNEGRHPGAGSDDGTYVPAR